MELIKYSSIENSVRDKFVDQIKTEGKDGGDWVVTEKVHGGQFSLYYDGQEVKASTRTAFLSAGMDFFNWEKVKQENEDKVKDIFRILKSRGEEVDYIIVYGELFGGDYPQAGVNKVKGARRLQKGVYYHPDNLFYVFDIKVNGRYLTVDEVNPLFEQVGLFYARTLFRGSLEACMNHANDFLSKIPDWLGLPQIEGNIAEGIVIKPVDPRFLTSGDRVILKSKNEKFEERKSVKKRPVPQDEVIRTPDGIRLGRELESLVTENRLQNVLSKMTGSPAFGEVMKALDSDVWEEFNKDHRQEYDNLDKKEQKEISRAVNQLAVKLVRAWHLKNC